MAYGWSSGMACKTTAQDAMAERCSRFSLSTSSSTYSCVGEAVAGTIAACGTPSSATGVCHVAMKSRMHTSTAETSPTSGAQYTGYWTMHACDLTTDNPFRMSVADGATLSMLIIGVWVAALIFRNMIKVVRVNDAE